MRTWALSLAIIFITASLSAAANTKGYVYDLDTTVVGTGLFKALNDKRGFPVEISQEAVERVTPAGNPHQDSMPVKNQLLSL